MKEKKQEKPGAPNPEDPKQQNQKSENLTPTAPKEGANKMESDIRGYPRYPDTEDVFVKDKEEKDIDPEDVTKKKPNNIKDAGGDKVYVEDEAGEDLDVPGNEEDEKEENAGSEDEENNYYSLGGDDHNDLEEDKNIN